MVNVPSVSRSTKRDLVNGLVHFNWVRYRYFGLL
ncbi:hypothetical protein D047_1366A, partial [Vibrio parahaemolyticus VPTS-2010_2]